MCGKIYDILHYNLQRYEYYLNKLSLICKKNTYSEQNRTLCFSFHTNCHTHTHKKATKNAGRSVGFCSVLHRASQRAASGFAGRSVSRHRLVRRKQKRTPLIYRGVRILYFTILT